MLRTYTWRAAVLLAMPVGLLTASHGADSAATVSSDLVVARFPIDHGPGPLLIPVRIAGKDHIFLADTGMTVTGMEVSLLSGKRLRPVLVKTAGGVCVMDEYEPPVASIGTTPCRFGETVLSVDLTRLRNEVRLPIEGILGMDILGQHVLHLNFDEGELLLLKSAPAGAGRPIPIDWEPGDTPTILGFVPGADRVRFMIDTGHISLLSGSLNGQLVQGLAAQGKLVTLGRAEHGTQRGRMPCAVVRGQLLALGEFAVRDPLFIASDGNDNLGICFWSRFTVTFDFPGKKVLLTKGKRYRHPDVGDCYGLDLGLRDGAVIVERSAHGQPRNGRRFSQGRRPA